MSFEFSNAFKRIKLDDMISDGSALPVLQPELSSFDTSVKDKSSSGKLNKNFRKKIPKNAETANSLVNFR
jgi:hypothetical protein